MVTSTRELIDRARAVDLAWRLETLADERAPLLRKLLGAAPDAMGAVFFGSSITPPNPPISRC